MASNESPKCTPTPPDRPWGRWRALDYGAIKTNPDLSLHDRCLELRQGITAITNKWMNPQYQNGKTERSRTQDALNDWPYYLVIYESPRNAHNPKVNLHHYFAAIGVFAVCCPGGKPVGATEWTRNYPTSADKKAKRIACAADLFEIPPVHLLRVDARDWADALLMAHWASQHLKKFAPRHRPNAIISFDPGMRCTGYAIVICGDD